MTVVVLLLIIAMAVVEVLVLIFLGIQSIKWRRITRRFLYELKCLVPLYDLT